MCFLILYFRHRRSLLAKTPNLADPHSKTKEKRHEGLKREYILPYTSKYGNYVPVLFLDLCQLMLRERKGAAFDVTNHTGMLAPFSVETIEITSYCDMWGAYNDEITFRVC